MMRTIPALTLLACVACSARDNDIITPVVVDTPKVPVTPVSPAPPVSPDSIFVSSLLDKDAQLWVDALAYNPNGSLAALVPEPGGLALLGLAALLVSRRRKR